MSISSVPVFRLLSLMLLLALHSMAYADYSQHPKAQAIVDQLVEQHQFTPQQVRQILRQANTEQRILDSMANAAEKTKTWTQYRQSFLSTFRIEKGVEFLRKYDKVFDKVEKHYQVPREIITAILGVETNYGGYTGKANVLDALATLAFEHPRRGKFFRSELIEYLVLSREQAWQADAQLGSYAGAMGMSQFMPSNYRRLAVDGNKDGKVDLFEPVDAIHSIANYFVHHGWQPGAPISHRAAVDVSFDKALISNGLKPNSTVEKLAAAGFHSQKAIDPSTAALVIRFNDSDGDEFWLGYHNFYVISRYNPRSKYAMATFQLGEAIAKQYRQSAN